MPDSRHAATDEALRHPFVLHAIYAVSMPRFTPATRAATDRAPRRFA